jgi:hypothetical protein
LQQKFLLTKTAGNRINTATKRMERKFSLKLWIAAAILTSGLMAFAQTKGDKSPIEVTISGNISHSTFTKGESGTVTFSRFPATVEEFKQVREKIGGEPHGAVALQLMAYEMYRHDKNIGTDCIKLNNTTNNINLATNRLKELFGSDVNYARPYQIAAFLKDATPDNGYNPKKPYTVEITVNDVQPYQKSNNYQTDVIYLKVHTKGKDRGSEVVEVIKTLKPGEPSEGKYFIVLNSPGLYSQVKAVSFANPFQGLD